MSSASVLVFAPALALVVQLLHGCGGDQKPEGAGHLQNPASGKCLDVFAHMVDGHRAQGSELGDEANIQLYDCHGKDNQIFEFGENGEIINPATNMCVDVGGDNESALDEPKMANVQLFTCKEGKAGQQWTFHADGTIESVGAPGHCIDIFAHIINETSGERATGSTLDNMANVQLYTCHKEDNQIWKFLPNGTDVSEMEANATRLFQASQGLHKLLTSHSHGLSAGVLALTAVGVSGLVIAAFVGIRAWRTTTHRADVEEYLDPDCQQVAE